MLAFEANPAMLTDAELFRWVDMSLDYTLEQKTSMMAPEAPAAQQLQPYPNLLGYLTSALGTNIGNVLHAHQVQPQQGTLTTATESLRGLWDNYDSHALTAIKGWSHVENTKNIRPIWGKFLTTKKT